MKIKIQDIEVEYHVFHREVKYARLEIKNNELNLILPLGVDDHHKLIKKHEKWVYQKISRINRLKEESKNRKLDLTRSKQEFRELVKLLVNEISDQMGSKVNMVSFRRMKTRWGSCSSSGNLNFNTRLRYLPESLIRYVVHHEVCHLQIRKHNKHYWNLVSLTYSNCKDYENELAIYWLLVKDLN
ncbi:MAG: putative metal-dependent hydrolase [Methanobacterium sp. Maddingley MBC34]|nr:MAG: putative metal-dependent hydrolase [Methanobacterium sp. Maddingley MBC34]